MIDELVSQGKKVYVHDVASATRAPSAAIVYKYLYMQPKEWPNVETVEKEVERDHDYSTPNMHIVRKAIKENIEI